MKIERKALLQKLKDVMMGLNKDDSLSQGTDNFIFHNNMLSTYNNNVSITVRTDDVLNDLNDNICVHGSEFFDILSKFDDNTINLEVTNNTLVISTDNAKVEMKLFDFEQSKLLLENIRYDDNNFIEIPDNFIDVVSNCIMDNKSKYSGIYIKDNIVYSTDSRRLNYGKLNGDIHPFAISNDCALKLLKLNGIKYIQVNDSWVHFKSDSFVLSIKCIRDDSFPYDGCQRIIDRVKNNTYIVTGTLTNDIFSSIERSSNFSSCINNENNVIEVTLSENNIKILGEKLIGKYEESINNESINATKAIKFNISANTLFDMKNKGKFSISSNLIVFTNDKTTHVIAIRTEDV